VDQILIEIGKLLEAKRVAVRHKIQAVRDAFEKLVEPELFEARDLKPRSVIYGEQR
jgi:hypothetical protein